MCTRLYKILILGMSNFSLKPFEKEENIKKNEYHHDRIISMFNVHHAHLPKSAIIPQPKHIVTMA